MDRARAAALLVLLPLAGLHARNVPGLPGLLGDVVEIVEITPTANRATPLSRADWPYGPVAKPFAPLRGPAPQLHALPSSDISNKVLLELILELRDQLQQLLQRQVLLEETLLKCGGGALENCSAAEALKRPQSPSGGGFQGLQGLQGYNGGIGVPFGGSPVFSSAFTPPRYDVFGNPHLGGYGNRFGSSLDGGGGSGFGNIFNPAPNFGSGFGVPLFGGSGFGFPGVFGMQSSRPGQAPGTPLLTMPALKPGQPGGSNFVSTSTVMGTDGKIQTTTIQGTNDKPPIITTITKEPGEEPVMVTSGGGTREEANPVVADKEDAAVVKEEVAADEEEKQKEKEEVEAEEEEKKE